MPDYLKTTFNCYNAMNLDAGGSLGMVYKGTVKSKEGRKIMDAFVVVESATPFSTTIQQPTPPLQQ